MLVLELLELLELLVLLVLPRWLLLSLLLLLFGDCCYRSSLIPSHLTIIGISLSLSLSLSLFPLPHPPALPLPPSPVPSKGTRRQH